MKVLAALISLLAISGVTLFLTENRASLQAASTDEFQQYVQWKAEFSKNTNGVEDEYRFAIFLQNLRYVEANNAKATGNDVVLKMTKFADLTNQEYQEKYLTNIVEHEMAEQVEVEATNASSINWIEKGAVTGVKDQGVCGSCWAFSTTAGTEGAYFVSQGKLENLSNQQVTSCAGFPNMGCNGGNSLYAYNYVAKNGIETEASYPYVQKDNNKTAPCQFNASKVVYQTKGSQAVPSNNPTAMLNQLQVQPLSVAVDASSLAFQLYSGGVLSSTSCGTGLNHAITLVGYDATTNAWNIKNSWGTSWGAKGYIQIVKSEGNGICGVNMDVSYPTF